MLRALPERRRGVAVPGGSRRPGQLLVDATPDAGSTYGRVVAENRRALALKRAAEVVAARPGRALPEDEAGLLAELARIFRFPDYFGGNWDAADECLRDLSWLPARGYVLRVPDAESLWRSLPAAAGRLVETWLFCAEEWARQGAPFHLVFQWGAAKNPEIVIPRDRALR